ncbi:MAG TPA: hypothetical protein VHB68_16665 [Steroidobacteraceae bacterium]|nr:hypothetical protein [Steroidobacteraceae bacterium]
MPASIGGQLNMKPTSEQTRLGVLSSVPFVTEDLLRMRELFRYPKSSDAASTAKNGRPEQPAARAGVDPSSAYGCVDWYL